IPILEIHIHSPSQAVTGDGGTAMKGNGGRSGDIGTNGSGGKGGKGILATDWGNIETPRGGSITPGGDRRTSFNRTREGASTAKGIAGASGDIGRNSNGGDAGPITITATHGNVTGAGVLILRGGIASNSGDHTGDGGTATVGTGGSSGSIGTLPGDKRHAGGTGGKGGKVGNTPRRTDTTPGTNRGPRRRA